MKQCTLGIEGQFKKAQPAPQRAVSSLGDLAEGKHVEGQFSIWKQCCIGMGMMEKESKRFLLLFF